MLTQSSPLREGLNLTVVYPRALALNCNAAVNEKDGAEARDWKAGKPVRVVRSSKGRKHSKFSPEDGNRYDGIYKVGKRGSARRLAGPMNGWIFFFIAICTFRAFILVLSCSSVGLDWIAFTRTA